MTKLGEIVAPLDSDEDDVDDNKAAQMREERLTPGDEPSDGGNEGANGMISHFTTLTAANLPGIFKEMVNDTASRSAPPRSNDSSGSRTRPLDSYNFSSQPTSSCMVEVEMDESFESTTPLSPSFEEVHLAMPTKQLIQEDIVLNSEIVGGHYSPRSEVRQLSEPSLSPVQIPSDESHQHSPNDFAKSSYVPPYLVSNLDHKGDNSDYISSISPISVSSVAFQPIANNFPMYKPPGYAPSSSQKDISPTASNTPTESVGDSYGHSSAVVKEAGLGNESDVFVGNQSCSAIYEDNNRNHALYPPPLSIPAGTMNASSFFDFNNSDNSVDSSSGISSGAELLGGNVLEERGRENDVTANSFFLSNNIGIQNNAVQNISIERNNVPNEDSSQSVLSERIFLSNTQNENENEAQGRRDAGREKEKERGKERENEVDIEEVRDRERQKDKEREALIEAHMQKNREMNELSALLGATLHIFSILITSLYFT